jgi:hypothetical protein
MCREVQDRYKSWVKQAKILQSNPLVKVCMVSNFYGCLDKKLWIDFIGQVADLIDAMPAVYQAHASVVKKAVTSVFIWQHSQGAVYYHTESLGLRLFEKSGPKHADFQMVKADGLQVFFSENVDKQGCFWGRWQESPAYYLGQSPAVLRALAACFDQSKLSWRSCVLYLYPILRQLYDVTIFQVEALVKDEVEPERPLRMVLEALL